MGTDLSKFKVVYKEKVLKAVALVNVQYSKDIDFNAQYKKPKFIEILAINEDGNIVAIRDEAWMFQFITTLLN